MVLASFFNAFWAYSNDLGVFNLEAFFNAPEPFQDGEDFCNYTIPPSITLNDETTRRYDEALEQDRRERLDVPLLDDN